MPVAQLLNKNLTESYQDMMQQLDKEHIKMYLEEISTEMKLTLVEEDYDKIINKLFETQTLVDKKMLAELLIAYVEEKSKKETIVNEDTADLEIEFIKRHESSEFYQKNKGKFKALDEFLNARGLPDDLGIDDVLATLSDSDKIHAYSLLGVTKNTVVKEEGEEDFESDDMQMRPDEGADPEDAIMEIIGEALLENGYDVRTYADAMMLTNNKGLVIKTPSGKEVHITFPGTYEER